MTRLPAVVPAVSISSDHGGPVPSLAGLVASVLQLAEALKRPEATNGAPTS
jgi:hypothetical protein